MQYFRCSQKDYRASHCIKTVTNTNSEKQSDDKKYKLSESISSTKTEREASITKLHNYPVIIKGICDLEYHN